MKIDRLSRVCFAPDDGGAGGAGAGASGGAGSGGSPDPGAGAGAGAGAGSGAGASGSGAASWVKALQGDSRTIVEKKGWKSIDDVITSYVNLEAKINQKGIIPPGKDAKPEEIAAFHRALGVPETPDKYDLGDFKPPEDVTWDENAQKAILARMHKAGATPAVVREALAAYAEWAAATTKERDERAAAFVKQSEQTLRKEWGDDYDKNREVANLAARVAFGDHLEAATKIRLEDGTFLLDHPLIARAFYNAGLGMAEDTLAGVKQGGRAGVTLTELEAKRAAMIADPEISKAATDRSHPRHDEVVKQLNAIDEQIVRLQQRRSRNESREDDDD